MSHLNLNPAFLDAAKKILHEEFTVDRLTETYLSLDVCAHGNKKSARQFIYRNMQRLMESGELEKYLGKNNWPTYKFKNKFHVHLQLAQNIAPISPTEGVPSNRDVQACLRERLNLLKMEMLTAMGEVEEYGALETEIPRVKSAAQKLAGESRDRCSKLLGKVKAIETLLNA